MAQEVKEMLAEKGYKPEFGARELRRVVERELEMKLAEKLLQHNRNDINELKAFIEQQSIVIY